MNNVPKNRQKQCYRRMVKHLPEVSIAFQKLGKDGSITDTGTKSMRAVTLFQTLKINDEPSRRGTICALEIVDLVDKQIHAEAAAVLGTVNGHEFAQHLVAVLTADRRARIKRRGFRQCVSTTLANCGPKGCLTSAFNRQAFNVKNQRKLATAHLRKVRSKFGNFCMKGQNRLQVATRFLELGVLLGENSMSLLECNFVKRAETRLPGRTGPGTGCAHGAWCCAGRTLVQQALVARVGLLFGPRSGFPPLWARV